MIRYANSSPRNQLSNVINMKDVEMNISVEHKLKTSIKDDDAYKTIIDDVPSDIDQSALVKKMSQVAFKIDPNKQRAGASSSSPVTPPQEKNKNNDNNEVNNSDNHTPPARVRQSDSLLAEYEEKVTTLPTVDDNEIENEVVDEHIILHNLPAPPEVPQNIWEQKFGPECKDNEPEVFQCECKGSTGMLHVFKNLLIFESGAKIEIRIRWSEVTKVEALKSKKLRIVTVIGGYTSFKQFFKEFNKAALTCQTGLKEYLEAHPEVKEAQEKQKQLSAASSSASVKVVAAVKQADENKEQSPKEKEIAEMFKLDSNERIIHTVHVERITGVLSSIKGVLYVMKTGLCFVPINDVKYDPLRIMYTEVLKVKPKSLLKFSTVSVKMKKAKQKVKFRLHNAKDVAEIISKLLK